ncbi:MAG: hypothetical protein K6G80_01665 [Treponema sp.]|nr:hypothetical protein [Treponema sp.]
MNYGTVIGKGDGLGGILGYQQGSCIVDSCVNRGAVQSTGASKTGGIAGLAFGIVRNCINKGGRKRLLKKTVACCNILLYFAILCKRKKRQIKKRLVGWRQKKESFLLGLSLPLLSAL